MSLLTFCSFFRFYKLDWGQGLFTHPDEYHIVASVAQLSYPDQLNPHFFSYGTVTIYLIYFTQEIANFLSTTLNSFLIGRFYSALFSTLTIVVVYKICRFFMENRYSYLAALLTALTPGLIQQAHFATPESALTFFLFGSLLFIIKFLKQNRILFLVLASLFLGFAMGVKISSIVFLLPLTTAILSKSYYGNVSRLKNVAKTILKSVGLALTGLIVTITTFALVAPYVFLDFPAFQSNLDYEGGLAIGKVPVFYTRQFINTTPVLFQMEKILPYVLGPALTTFAILGFIFLILSIVKKPKLETIILTVSFLSLFIPNAFLFAKWTRFIAPTFPFFGIFAAIAIQTFASKTRRSVYYLLCGLLLIGTLLWTMAFFSIYTNLDVRIIASKWLESNTKEGSSFLVEGGNTIDLPLNGNFQKTSIDFYPLEEDPLVRERTANALYSSDYFLVQSRRVFYNHQRLPDLYPKTARFYNALFNGQMGFNKIQEFHQYPTLGIGNWKLEIHDEEAEETWSVFDHPVIRVFKKNQQFAKEEYAKFLE